MIEIGKRLIEIKKELEHGQWLSYLGNELGWTYQTGNRFMKIAREFSCTNYSIPSNLQSSKVIELLSLPSDARNEFILSFDEDIESITVKQLRDEIRKYKKENGLLTEKLKVLLATNFMRQKNDPAKQVKVASEYVELVGMKQGRPDKTSESRSFLSRKEIAEQLGVSETCLRELLDIDRKLIPQIRELFDNGEITKYTANKVWCRLSPEDQERFFNEIGRDKISQMTQAQTQKYIDDLKQGRRFLELERIYGIKNGNNQYSLPNCSEPTKTQKQLALENNCSVDTWNNKKNLTKLIPELQQLKAIKLTYMKGEFYNEYNYDLQSYPKWLLC